MQWFWIPISMNYQLPDPSDYMSNSARSWNQENSVAKMFYPILPLPLYKVQLPNTKSEGKKRTDIRNNFTDNEEAIDESIEAELESKRELLKTKAKVRNHKPIKSDHKVISNEIVPALVPKSSQYTVKNNNSGRLIIENLGRSHKVLIYPLSDDPEILRKKPVTKIILKPESKAIAGANGTAIASPISRAIVRRGDYVEIDYAPKSIAVVGNGGTAQSEPQLVITFQDRKRRK